MFTKKINFDAIYAGLLFLYGVALILGASVYTPEFLMRASKLLVGVGLIWLALLFFKELFGDKNGTKGQEN